MYTGQINIGMSALYAATGSVRKADQLMLDAVEAVGRGDIIDAVLNIQEAKITAKSGIAITRTVNDLNESLLDILA